MPRRESTTRKQTTKEASAIRSRIKNLVGREIGQATIIKDKLKQSEFTFDYPIDDLRSLSFKIIITPVMDKSQGFVTHMSVNPGKPP